MKEKVGIHYFYAEGRERKAGSFFGVALFLQLYHRPGDTAVASLTFSTAMLLERPRCCTHTLPEMKMHAGYSYLFNLHKEGKADVWPSVRKRSEIPVTMGSI